MKFVVIALFSVALANAANLDGKWATEVTAAGRKSTPAKKAAITLDLKSQNGALTGSVTTGSGKHSRPAMIQDGKVEGSRFTFTAVQHNKKKGDVKFIWQGTVNGDQITGTRSRDGAKHGAPFSGKRES